MEAICSDCGETYIPDNLQDIHLERVDGEECGGIPITADGQHEMLLYLKCTGCGEVFEGEGMARLHEARYRADAEETHPHEFDSDIQGFEDPWGFTFWISTEKEAF